MHVLVVGSSDIDLFLSLDRQHYSINDKKVLLSLGDKIPTAVKKMALGGNGSNASVGLTRLEIPTTFYTYLGDDILASQIEQTMTSEGVALKPQRAHGSTPMSLILDFDSDRIILTHHEERDHKFSLDDKSFDFIYLHSIGVPWEEVYKQVLQYSKENNIPLAFSPGSKQIEAANETFYEVLKNTKIYFSNREEAAKITNSDPSSDIKDLLSKVKSLGPQIVSITDGASGAYAQDENGDTYFIKPSPAKGVEKTGAGDAYASAFFAGALHGISLPDSMSWGAYNAEAVMSEVGAEAGLLTKKQLDEKLKNNNNLIAEKI